MVKERTGQYAQLKLFAVARWDAQFAHRELGVQTAVRASGGGGVSLRGALEEDSKEWEAINRLSLITNFFQIKPSIFLTSTSSWSEHPQMRVLLTNDDGPPTNPTGPSPYIWAFYNHLTALGWDVKVVIPSSQKSWIGKLSLAALLDS
jgi:hypothetical protein